MSSEVQTEPRAAALSRQVLLEQIGLNLYRINAFRITGLPVDASTKEIARHADKLKLIEELGQPDDAAPSPFALTPRPSIDQIREAIRRLRDPEKRLIDEFFWFWPMPNGNDVTDPGLQALTRGDPNSAFAVWSEAESHAELGFIATHNIAVMCHLMAVEWTLYETAIAAKSKRGEEIHAYWSEAVTRWKKVARSDALWNAVRTRIRALDDLRLQVEFEHEMRESLLDSLSLINAEAAVKFTDRQQLELARTQLNLARETQQDPDRLVKTAHHALAPALTRLKQRMASELETARTDPSKALVGSRELLEQARHTLSLVALFFGETSEAHNDLSDEVAAACNALQFSYHKATGDHKACIATLQTILPLVSSAELRQQIAKNIRTLTGLLQQKELEPIYALLKEIHESKETPTAKLRRCHGQIVTALSAIQSRSIDVYAELCDALAFVLRGISLAAWNEHQDMTTAVSANDLALRHAHDKNIREQLTNDKKALSQMGAQRRANLVAKLGCWGPIGIVVLLAFIGSFASKQTSSSSNTSYTEPSSSNSSQSGTYHIPSYRTAELNRDGQAIEATKNQLQHLDWQLEGLRTEIEQDRLFLDNASQDRVNAFNAKVDRYNSLLRDERSQAQAVNQMVDDYNEKLRRYSQ